MESSEETYHQAHFIQMGEKRINISDQRWAALEELAKMSDPPVSTIEYISKLLAESLKNQRGKRPGEGGDLDDLVLPG